MPDVRSTFEQLLGRQPSDQEVQALYRVKNTLGIRDNDALWLVLMALQSYDSLYRRYPELIAAEMAKIVSEQRAVLAETAQAETKRALGSLAEAVSATSLSLATSVAEASRYLSWGWVLIGLVVFGVLCMLVGASLAAGHHPGWASPGGTSSLPAMVVSTLGRTPAGWIVALAGSLSGLSAVWRLRGDIRHGRRLTHLVSAVALLALSTVFLIQTL